MKGEHEDSEPLPSLGKTERCEPTYLRESRDNFNESREFCSHSNKNDFLWSYAGWVISSNTNPKERRGECWRVVMIYQWPERREEREERDEQVISHSLRCLRCHHSHHALKAPLHVWTGSYPQFIRQTGQIFGDFNDMLPSTWINKINKLRGRQHSISTWNNFRKRSKKLSVFLSILSSLVWSHQLRVLIRGRNILVLLKICYSAANSIPKVFGVSVVIFLLLGDWLERTGLWWDE